MSYLHRELSQAESESRKDRFQRYMHEVSCPVYSGTYLRPEIPSMTLNSAEFGQKDIAELTKLSVHDGSAFLNSLTSGKHEGMITGRVLCEVQVRLKFLPDVGLDCLSLSHPAGALPSSEAQ